MKMPIKVNRKFPLLYLKFILAFFILLFKYTENISDSNSYIHYIPNSVQNRFNTSTKRIFSPDKRSAST